MINSKQKDIMFYAVPFSVLVLMFIYLVKGYYYTCLPAMDISIFSEAISRFWYEGVTNPFVNVLQLKIFNDHVDPIMMIFAPVHALFGYHLVTIICIPFLAILTTIFVIKKFYKLNGADLFFILTLMTFCRAIVGELSYPMHPILWSMPLLFIFVKKVMDHQILHAFICSILLLLFKETYAFALLSFSLGLILYHVLYKDKKTLIYGLIAFLISMSYLVWYFKLRPMWMDGKVFPYSGDHLKGIQELGLFGFAFKLLKVFNYKVFFTTFTPHAFLFWYNRNALTKNKNILLIFSWMSLKVLLHIYTNFFSHWHSVPFSIVLLATFCYMADFSKISRKSRVVSLLVFMICSIFLHVRAFNFVFFNKSKTCEISPEKMTYLNQMRDFIKSQKDNTAFLMTSGMIPWTLHPRFKMHQWGEYPSDRTNFDVIIFEKTNKGVHSRNSNEAIEEASRICHGSEVVLNNDYVFAAKGPFSQECISIKRD
jgi:hypothetical protein